LRGSFTQ